MCHVSHVSLASDGCQQTVLVKPNPDLDQFEQSWIFSLAHTAKQASSGHPRAHNSANNHFNKPLHQCLLLFLSLTLGQWQVLSQQSYPLDALLLLSPVNLLFRPSQCLKLVRSPVLVLQADPAGSTDKAG